MYTAHRSQVLTEMERAAVLAAARGLSATEAAREAVVGKEAIHARGRRVHDRLGTRHMAHALAIALVRGFITVNDLREALKERSE